MKVNILVYILIKTLPWIEPNTNSPKNSVDFRRKMDVEFSSTVL